MRGLEITHNCTLFMRLWNRKGVSSPPASPHPSTPVRVWKHPLLQDPICSLVLSRASFPSPQPSLPAVLQAISTPVIWFQLVKLYPCCYRTKRESLWVTAGSCDQETLGSLWPVSAREVTEQWGNCSTDFSYKPCFAWAVGVMSVLWKCCSLVQCNCKQSVSISYNPIRHRPPKFQL